MQKDQTEKRKKDHLELCLNGNVSYAKSNGFDNYEFIHNAITEVELSKLNFSVNFLKHKISYPFLISCMTGGTAEAESVNEKLALVASELNIPVGVGSQRQALENTKLHASYKSIRKNAAKVPVLGNIGAAQIAGLPDPVKSVKVLVDLVEADAMVVHVNPLQELLQPEGEITFKGLLKRLEKLCSKLDVPVFVKEVGSGINKDAARKLINAGVSGIDVAGSGGTSWAAVELLRSGNDNDNYFREWGLPTSYCVKTVAELKSKNKFTLIASGGINSGVDVAKALALGADLTASARVILQAVINSGVESTVELIKDWFATVGKIMFLTGASSLKEFNKTKIMSKEDLY